MAKISKRTVDALRAAPNQDVFLWDAGDGALKGFGVRVKPSGVGSYLVQYRNAEGRTRRLVVGRVGTLTPDQAREEARQRLAAVARGGDPAGERKAAREGMSVEELADWYLGEAEGWLKPSSLSLATTCFRKHIVPLLGNRLVAGLALADIEKMQSDIAAGKTRIARAKTGRTGEVKGGKVIAARAVTILGTAIEFAKRNKIVTENVTRGVRKFSTRKMKRFLSADEIIKLGEVIRAERNLPDGSTAANAIGMLLLTGCRRKEILSLPWLWVDANGQCLRFEDTKSGAQLRPIGQSAVHELAEMRSGRSGNSEWVFPSDKTEGHFIGLPRAFQRMCKSAKIDRATIHTLRHTYAAIAAELGFSELTIAGLLGHTLPGITARYAHVPDRALIMAADTVSARIAKLLGFSLEAVESEQIDSTTKIAA